MYESPSRPCRVSAAYFEEVTFKTKKTTWEERVRVCIKDKVDNYVTYLNSAVDQDERETVKKR